MLVDDSEAPLLKTWVVKKLEHISDADSDVLADYVLALVKTDDPAHVAKQTCIENLQDFIGDSSGPFVNDLFAAIEARSYDPSRPLPSKSAHKSSSNGLLPDYSRNGTTDVLGQNGSRKRTSRDWDASDQTNARDTRINGNRPAKQIRRGGRASLDARNGRAASNHKGRMAPLGETQQSQGFPQMPTPPPGMPPFDPNDPMASILAMQQLMGMMPGAISGISSLGPSQNSLGLGQSRAGKRCRDYDNKGFCARGANCPYDHGSEAYVVGSANVEYDPTQASLMNVQPSRTGFVDPTANERARGGHRGRGRGGTLSRGGGRRAEFSHAGPLTDRSATTIVVEQIPEDKFEEQAVRDFFSEFGTIIEVDMRAYKRLAIVKYEDHDAAQAAYDSPKSVFENRFVKVYWYKADSLPRVANKSTSRQPKTSGANIDTEMGEQEEQIDPVEFAKKQEEAQRKHEEAKKQREAHDKQKSDLDVRLKAIEAERVKMAAKLAEKSGKKMPLKTEIETSVQTSSNDQNAALKAKLAALEAEAKSLGIDPDAPSYHNGWNGPIPRGRGTFRGQPGRGAYNARGRGSWAGGAVKRLDNRPKTIAVAFLDGGYDDHQETLRQWLLFNSSEGATLTKHPERQDVALLTFPERYQGEVFMNAAGAAGFPLAGRIELSWHKQAATDGNASQNSIARTSAKTEIDAEIGEVHGTAPKENDYDVAADDDYWG